MDIKILGKDLTATEAIKDGMDRAVEFGPFLIVNGKERIIEKEN